MERAGLSCIGDLTRMRNLHLLSATALRSAFIIGAALPAAAFAQTTAAQTSGQPGQPEQTQPCTATSPNYNPNTGNCDLPSDGQINAGGNEPVNRDADGSPPNDPNEITITGTRIRIPNLENPEPTTTIDFRSVRERNFTNVADAINELPGIRGSVTPAGAQGSFGQGVNFINSYGLGSNRTLTLINGRRFVTSNPATNFGNAAAGTQVDLNVVPDILLDRVDIVSVGGAPVYGSDAISGVVGVVLRSKYQGVELQGVSGITEEGDNFRYNLSGLVGHDFFDGRLNLTAAVSHDNVEGVVYNDRAFLRDNVLNAFNISTAEAIARRFGSTVLNDGRLNTSIGFNDSPTDGFPQTVLVRNVRIPILSYGGLITATNLSQPLFAGFPQFCRVVNPQDPAACFDGSNPSPNRNILQFGPDGSLVPFQQATLFRGISHSGGDGFAFNDFSQITSDLRRTIGWGFMTLNVTDNIEAFAELTHYRSRADELVQQPTFNTSLFSATSAALVFMANNPMLTPQAQATLAQRGVTRFQLSRASTDLADLTGYNETRINRLVVGLRGDFSLLGRDMNFEAYVNDGRAKITEFRQDLNAQNFANAVNVTRDANGNIVCTTARTHNQPSFIGTNLQNNGFAAGGLAPIADPNCVPFNVFGSGAASQAARDYIIEDTTTETSQGQLVANANVGGSLFDLPGGAIGFNLGVEHREERADFRPDDFTRLGRGRAVPITPLSGDYKLDEAFGELLLPIISPDNNLPMVYGLQLFGRARYVDSSINGGFWSTTFGGTFAPIQDVEFRANKTRSFRHPAITELFLPVVPAFSTVPDLCSVANRNAGPAPATRAANCAAFLAQFPNATPDPANNATVPVLTGGNPDLENEAANSWTAGVILRPRFIPRLSLTADYVSITLEKPIASLTVAQIASSCFDNPSFNTADVLNANAFCSLIKRDSQGRVINDRANPAVRTGFVNGQRIKYRGLQGTVNYDLPVRMGSFLNGRFSIGADALYTLYRLNDITGVAPSPAHGVLGDPQFAGQLRLRYTDRQWGISTTVNYVGEQLFSRLNREPGPNSGPDLRELDSIDDYAIVGAGIFFDPTERFRFTVSVNNVFNYQGMEYMGFLHPSSYVDLLGRRFAASARVRF